MKKGHCIHYTGREIFLGKPCDAGIAVRELVGGKRDGWFLKTPCFQEHETEIKCESFLGPTDEELEENEKAWKKKIDEITLVIPLVTELKEYHGKTGGSGSRDCPVCGGKFRYQISAYNGHIWAECDTLDCVKFIE